MKMVNDVLSNIKYKKPEKHVIGDIKLDLGLNQVLSIEIKVKGK